MKEKYTVEKKGVFLNLSYITKYCIIFGTRYREGVNNLTSFWRVFFRGRLVYLGPYFLGREDLWIPKTCAELPFPFGVDG